MIRTLAILVFFAPALLFAGSPVCIGYSLDAAPSQRYRPIDATGAFVGPSELKAADFDGDGQVDVTAAGDTGLDVLFGDGSGRFLDQIHLSDEGIAGSAIADLDGDGRPDIVAIGTALRLFRNLGDRKFAPHVDLPAGSHVAFVVTGDFTSDGRIDLLLFGDDTRLLVNEGGELFTEGVLPPITGPHGVAAGDFDGDGHLDFVVTRSFENDASLTIYRGDGNGSFAIADSRRSNFRSVLVADINGDGRDDVIAYSPNAPLLYAFTHGLTEETPINLDVVPSFAIAADFNADGSVDLAILPPLATSQTQMPPAVRVLLNDGTGGFTTPRLVPTSDDAAYIAAADFDGDGRLDLAISMGYFYSFSIAQGFGDGSFRTFRLIDGLGAEMPMIAADLDGDGIDEIIVNHYDNLSSQLRVIRDIGGNFTSENVASVSGFPLSVAAGDIDGDRQLEIAVGGSPGVVILQRSAAGVWNQRNSYAMENERVEDVRFLDADGDGRDELAFLTSYGREVPSLTVTSPFRGIAVLFNAPLVPAAQHLASADVNGDGIPDLVVASFGTGSGVYELPPPNNGYVSVFIGRGDGTFEPERRVVDHQNFDAVLAGDFDGDGNADIIVHRFLGIETMILRGDGHGHFSDPATIVSLSDRYADIRGYDLNGDEVLDLIASTFDSVVIVSLLRDGSERHAEFMATGAIPLVIRTRQSAAPSIVMPGLFSALFPGMCARTRAARH